MVGVLLSLFQANIVFASHLVDTADVCSARSMRIGDCLLAAMANGGLQAQYLCAVAAFSFLKEV